jgi:hypothetical protein
MNVGIVRFSKEIKRTKSNKIQILQLPSPYLPPSPVQSHATTTPASTSFLNSCLRHSLTAQLPTNHPPSCQRFRSVLALANLNFLHLHILNMPTCYQQVLSHPHQPSDSDRHITSFTSPHTTLNSRGSTQARKPTHTSTRTHSQAHTHKHTNTQTISHNRNQHIK